MSSASGRLCHNLLYRAKRAVWDGPVAAPPESSEGPAAGSVSLGQTMPIECPVCHTSNPPGSISCVHCSNPIESSDALEAFDGPTDPGVGLAPPKPPAGVLAEGSVLGERYEILKMLGEGGMGTVYKARDREVDRLVALKVIRSELANKPEILRRFKQELILARQVTHRNVIRIFDLGNADNVKFITMDFVDGRDLKSVISERRKMPAGDASDIIRQICLGLEAAHNEGVVHRDLKPQNIMLDVQGRVYLMDFGLARSMELVGMTRTGALLGTPAYMSPEQAKGEKVDSRTDLFALGVIFYEMLTGVLPYRADSMMATLIKRSKEMATPPNHLEPSIPAKINDVVMKCLQINPERRYQNAGEILQDLGFATPAPASMIANPSMVDASSGLAPGTQFGPRYRIDSVLGEGGMGKVYKAQDTELGRTVALKLVRQELASNPTSMERLKQELLLASRVSHKNILRIHDLGDVSGLKFISMAYVDGTDLYQIIAREGRLPVDRAVRIARQLCLALEAAHNEAVIHRDLKPQNVLMDRDDNVFVSDFGLAKSLESQSPMMTTAREVLGTPRYMSPEQAESNPVDHRSDLYSLGLILYEMVTGDLPFASESVIQTMYQRVTQTPRNPKVLNPDLPDYLSAIIMRCLEKDPEQRYQHAREIVDDLDRAQSTPSPVAAVPTTAPPPPVAAPLEPVRPRRSFKLVYAVAAAVLVLLGLVFAIPKTRQAALGLVGKSSKTAAGPSRNAKYLAILPFHVNGDDATLGYAASGIADSLFSKLFQLKDMHLASPSAAAKVNPKDPIDQIARSLGAKLLVQGSVQGAGEKISVVVSLDEAATGRRIWSQQFSGLQQDLLTIQDQIYTGLVSSLDLKLTNEEQAKGSAHFTENVGAYDLYLKGRALLQSGHRDDKTLKQALALFDEATQKDPAFTLAYTGIADTCLYLYNLKKDNTWAVRALGAANRAQTLNDNLPEVHFALGSVFTATGRTAEAVSELKRALDLAPNSDDGYRRLGRAYMNMGQKTDALNALQQAVDANPYYASNYTLLGTAYALFGDRDNAAKAFRHVTELDPKNAAGWTNVGGLASEAGNWNESIPAFQKAIELQPSPESYSNLGTSYFYLRNYEQARVNFAKAVEMSPEQAGFLGNLADCYRRLGQQAKARTTYDQAISLAYKALQTNPRDATSLSYLGVYYAKEGDSTKGLQFIARARAIDAENVDFLYDEAVINTIASRMPEALKSLEGALAKGYSQRQVLADPELAPLRQQPEFQAMIQKVQKK
jgi:serine/threonine protein kinase/tetratricopeptide (TPR) repeat protein